MAGVTLVAALSGAAVTVPHAGTGAQTVALAASPLDVALDGRAGRAFITTSDGSNTNRVVVMNTRTGAVLNSVQIGRGAYPLATFVDQQWSRVFVLDQNTDRIGTLDASSGHLIRLAPTGQNPTSLALDRRTGHVFVVNMTSSSLSMVDARSGALLRTVPLASVPSSIAVDQRNGRAFVGTYSGAVDVVDTRSGAILRSSTVDGGVVTLGVDQRAARVVVVGYGLGYRSALVSTLDAASGRPLRGVNVNLLPSALSIDEQAGRAIVSDEEGSTIAIFSTRSGTLLRTMASPLAPALIVVDTATDRLFVVGQYTLSMAILSVRTGATMRMVRLENHPTALTWIDAAVLDGRDNHLLISSDYGNSARLGVLDGYSGAVLRTITIGVSPVTMDARAGRAVVVGSPLPQPTALDTIGEGLGRFLQPLVSPLCPSCQDAFTADSSTSDAIGGVSLVDVSG